MEKYQGSETIANKIVEEVIGGNFGSKTKIEKEVKD